MKCKECGTDEHDFEGGPECRILALTAAASASADDAAKLRAELTALKTPVGSEEEREALEWASDWDPRTKAGKNASVLARALRQRSAEVEALKVRIDDEKKVAAGYLAQAANHASDSAEWFRAAEKAEARVKELADIKTTPAAVAQDAERSRLEKAVVDEAKLMVERMRDYLDEFELKPLKEKCNALAAHEAAKKGKGMEGE